MEVKTKFEPAPDITAYEVAIIVQNVVPKMSNATYFTEKVWDNLPHYLKRHFIEVGRE